jgi:hypothetical protein
MAHCFMCGGNAGPLSMVVTGRASRQADSPLWAAWEHVLTLVQEAPGTTAVRVSAELVARGFATPATADSLIDCGIRTGRLTQLQRASPSLQSHLYPSAGNPAANLDALLADRRPSQLADRLAFALTSWREVYRLVNLPDTPRRMLVTALASLIDDSADLDCDCGPEVPPSLEQSNLHVSGQDPTHVTCFSHIEAMPAWCTFCRGSYGYQVREHTTSWGPLRLRWRSCGSGCPMTVTDAVRS